MDKKLINRLLLINEEEKFLSQEDASAREIYTKSSRFVIERRHMSSLAFGNLTSPIILKAHPRFRDFPAHSHDFIEFMYVASGKITHLFGDRKITLVKGETIVFGKNTRHGVLAASKNDIGINIIISPDLFEGLVNDLRQSELMPERLFEPLLSEKENICRIFRSAENKLVENIIENMARSIFEPQNAGAFVLRQSLLLLMSYLADTADEKTEISDAVNYTERTKRQVRDYIRTSYKSATLTEAAQMLGLSPPYLSRWIKKHFGKTFKTLLTDQRFDIACELLLTSARIGEIVEKVGYENSSYFHKEFKRRFGMTPANYRKTKKFLST